MLENPSKNSWICIQMQDPNSRCGCLPKLHQFFLVHRHICGKIFMKPSSSFYVKLPTNKQKDKNRGHASQNLGQYSRTAFSKGPIFKTRSKSIRQLKEKYKLAASPDWILNLDEFWNVLRKSLFKDTAVKKFPWRFHTYAQKYCKMPYLAMLKNPLKCPENGSRSRWVPHFNQFFPGPMPTCTLSLVKIAVELWAVAHKLTHNMTDRQMQLTNMLTKIFISWNLTPNVLFVVKCPCSPLDFMTL